MPRLCERLLASAIWLRTVSATASLRDGRATARPSGWTSSVVKSLIGGGSSNVQPTLALWFAAVSFWLAGQVGDRVARRTETRYDACRKIASVKVRHS